MTLVTGGTALAAAPAKGIWASGPQIQALPTSGPAWTQLLAAANASPGVPNLADMTSGHDVATLAEALVYARTQNQTYRLKAVDGIMRAIGTENGGSTLSLGRNLVSYVIAADLVNLADFDAVKEQQFRSWLSAVRTENVGGRTLVSTHEDRPNNWGTHSGASRIAADLYLGDVTDLARAARVLQGYLGDRSVYASFAYGDLSWQFDSSRPVGVNPANATKSGHSVDGVLPDDQRRAGTFTWPAPKENYVWEALQGATVQAELLNRAGYAAWGWSDRALLRAVTWLHSQVQYPAAGDDQWMPWLVNARYGTSFPAAMPARTGKNMGFTDWLFGSATGTSSAPVFTVLPAANAPAANFDGTPTSGTSPLSVAFVDRSTNSPTAWTWNFGDGTTSTQQNPVHVYSKAGTFSVTLTVRNSAGSSTKTRAGLVVVSAPAAAPTSTTTTTNTTTTNTTPTNSTSSTLTFLPTADAKVNSLSPGKNYGREDFLRARMASDQTYRSYLRFDVTGVSRPIVRAKLRMLVVDDSPVGGEIRPTSAAWSENGVTWANAPAPGPSPVASLARVAVGQWVEFDLTAVVTRAGSYNFVLTSPSTNSIFYASRESVTPPQLALTLG